MPARELALFGTSGYTADREGLGTALDHRAESET
jgi:hypothetical protein